PPPLRTSSTRRSSSRRGSRARSRSRSRSRGRSAGRSERPHSAPPRASIKSARRTPETGAMAAIPDTGELERTPLPRLLLELSATRFDGCLHLRRDRIEKTFLFQRGAPISAESSLASETLGLSLLDAGRITRADYHRVSSYVDERKVKEGVALLDLGLLDPKSLFLSLKEQARARLVEGFGCPRAT